MLGRIKAWLLGRWHWLALTFTAVAGGIWALVKLRSAFRKPKSWSSFREYQIFSESLIASSGQIVERLEKDQEKVRSIDDRIQEKRQETAARIALIERMDIADVERAFSDLGY